MAQPVKTATGKWRIQIEVKGQRDSGTFDTRRDALAWRDRGSTELRAVADGTVGDLRTLRDALRTYARDVSPSKRGWAKEIIRLQAFERQALPLDKPLAQAHDGRCQAGQSRFDRCHSIIPLVPFDAATPPLRAQQSRLGRLLFAGRGQTLLAGHRQNTRTTSR